MKKSRPKKAKRRRVDVNLPELDGILDAALEKPMSQDDHTKIKSALHAMASQNTPTWRSSEKTAAVMADANAEANGDPTESGAQGDAEPSGDEDKKKAPGHGRNGARAYTGARRVPVPHPELTRGCACPGELCKGKVYPLRDPKPIVRIVGQPLFAGTVYELEQMRCNLCGAVYPAPTPEGVGPEKYDESVSSMVAVMKYGRGLPWNRIEALQRQAGVPLPASVQWALVEAAASLLQPVFEEMIRVAAQADVVGNDDTGMLVVKLERPDDDTRTGTFTTGVVAQGEGTPTVALFFTGAQHAGENLGDVLLHRARELGPPIQMCDALSRNNPKFSPRLSDAAEDLVAVILANCLAHGRRKFVDVAENFPAECEHVLDTLGKVYQVDEQARVEKLNPEARLKLHQRLSEPLMKTLHVWLTAQLDEKRTEPNSGLGKAIKYLLNHWHALTLFLRVAGAPLDNNIVERALKKAVLHRKNALFYLTMNGAQVGDLFMSLIHTCELNKVNAFDYLVALQRHPREIREDPAAWMPWNYRHQLLPAPAG